jgi:nicotinamide mononucleotide transporter
MWEILSYVLTSLSITGLYLNAKKNIWCWPVWLLSSILWAVYFIHQHEIASIIMWIVYSGFNIFGWLEWSKK